MKKIAFFIIVAFWNSAYGTENLTSDPDILHAPFDAVLQEHVKDGDVNYAGIQQDKRYFDYLKVIETTNPDNFSNDKEKLVFWINAYNAFAIKGVLDGQSPSTLFGRLKFFKTTKYTIGSRKMNLEDLEKKIIIPEFSEPRIHFAIVCASISCPPLRSETFKVAKLEEQLDENARIFLSDTTKNKFSAEKKLAELSKIFEWFHEDFEKHSGSVQKYVAQYVENEEIQNALAAENYKITYLKYNWNLNGTAPKKN